ncbi:MAG: ClbS/DfsB family four-helix bundle protein [Anaerolineae bacterium]
MDDKQQVMARLGEMLSRWEGLLAGMTEEELTAPLVPSDWSIKDVMAHLWVWQQRTIARTEAAVVGGEPEFPQWPSGLDPDSEDDVQRINAWNYERKREQPWPTVHQEWSDGFRRLLDLADKVPEQDLLAVGRYPWLKDYSLALILDASREHHEEHLDDLLAWLQQHENTITGR